MRVVSLEDDSFPLLRATQETQRECIPCAWWPPSQNCRIWLSISIYSLVTMLDLNPKDLSLANPCRVVEFFRNGKCLVQSLFHSHSSLSLSLSHSLRVRWPELLFKMRGTAQLFIRDCRQFKSDRNATALEYFIYKRSLFHPAYSISGKPPLRHNPSI